MKPRSVGHASTLGLVALGLAALTAGALGLLHRAYNYDEVLRAHSVWLTAQGLKPYRDFFEAHPPYFPLLAWASRWSGEPRTYLTALRLIGLLGNLLFLGGLLRLGGPGVADRRWVWLGLGVVVLEPQVLDYLTEFRADGWGNGLTAWGLVLFRRVGAAGWRAFGLGAAAGFAGLLLCPKLVLLPPLVVLWDVSRPGTDRRRRFHVAGAFVAGLAAAGALVVVDLVANGIGIGGAFDGVVRYNAAINAHSGFGYGLAREVRDRWPLAVAAAVGAAVWAAGAARRREWPDPFLAGAATWLALQPALVSAPYKQYVAPWFLVAGLFVGLPGAALSARRRRLGAVVFGALVVAGVAVAGASAVRLAAGRGAEAQLRAIGWIRRVTRSREAVVVDPQFHPIDRPDTFWFWVNTYDPGGFDGERAAATVPSFRANVTDEHYRAELRARPPVLALIDAGAVPLLYPPRQQMVLARFLRDSGYRVVSAGGLRFALDAAAYERASRLGLADERVPPRVGPRASDRPAG